MAKILARAAHAPALRSSMAEQTPNLLAIAARRKLNLTAVATRTYTEKGVGKLLRYLILIAIVPITLTLFLPPSAAESQNTITQYLLRGGNGAASAESAADLHYTDDVATYVDDLGADLFNSNPDSVMIGDLNRVILVTYYIPPDTKGYSNGTDCDSATDNVYPTACPIEYDGDDWEAILAAAGVDERLVNADGDDAFFASWTSTTLYVV